MSKLSLGKLCLTDLNNAAKQGHSEFFRHENGKVYVRVKQYENDEPDKYGNDISVMLNSSKEKKDEEAKQYIGNLKHFEQQNQAPIKTAGERIDDFLNDDQLPF